MKTYHEKLFDEISNMIVNNLELLYNYDNDALINIRKHCIEHNHKRYKQLPYTQLVYFTEEAIANIINMPYLYDFRELE